MDANIRTGAALRSVPSGRSGKTRKGERTRARILQAAEGVFGQLGFHDASIVEITRRAEVALGTFYVHFPSKKAIFEELARARRQDLIETLRAATSGVAGRRERERVGLRTYFAWIAEHPAMYRIARQAEFVDPALHREWYQIFADAYATSLRRAMEAGEMETTEPELLAWAVMGMSDFVAMRFLLWEDATPLPQGRLEAFLEIATRALGLDRPD